MFNNLVNLFFLLEDTIASYFVLIDWWNYKSSVKLSSKSTYKASTLPI